MVKKKVSKKKANKSSNNFNRNLLIGAVIIILIFVVAFNFAGKGFDEEGLAQMGMGEEILGDELPGVKIGTSCVTHFCNGTVNASRDLGPEYVSVNRAEIDNYIDDNYYNPSRFGIGNWTIDLDPHNYSYQGFPTPREREEYYNERRRIITQLENEAIAKAITEAKFIICDPESYRAKHGIDINTCDDFKVEKCTDCVSDCEEANLNKTCAPLKCEARRVTPPESLCEIIKIVLHRARWDNPWLDGEDLDLVPYEPIPRGKVLKVEVHANWTIACEFNNQMSICETKRVVNLDARQ